MDELLSCVEDNIAEHQLLGDGDAVLLGVSGGLDSMVLLHVLHALAPNHSWRLIVAHFNHRLRGREAARDREFVRAAATKLGLRCEAASADVAELARSQKLSIEMAARRLRHDFLARAARGLGIGTVALAHHADDQVELFFLRLLRGAGSHGLGGMQWRSPSSADPAVALIRPLLNVRKTELHEFARDRRIRFREDCTNVANDILRNRVRQRLLPVLRKDFQPAVDSVVLRAMEMFRGEAEFIWAEAKRWLEGKQMDFAVLPLAVQRRIVQEQLIGAGVPAGFDLVERLRTRAGDWFAVGPNRQCRLADAGEVQTRQTTVPAISTAEQVISLAVRRGKISWEGIRISWALERRSKLAPRRGWAREFFDADKIGSVAILRHWRPGDRFQPIGMRSPQKLQDIFVNQKIPRNRRHILAIATNHAGEIFWVEGLRIGERFKVDADTERRLRWEWDRAESQVAAWGSEC